MTRKTRQTLPDNLLTKTPVTLSAPLGGRRGLTIVSMLFVLMLCAGVAYADDYLDARKQLIAAYEAGDHAAMVEAASKGLEARPAFPGGLYNLAFSHALAGDHDAALAVLLRLAAMRIDYSIETNPAFEGLRDHPDYSTYLSAIDAARQPVGKPDVAWSFEDGQFVPEGIAIRDGTLYLGSIRKGMILRQEPGKKAEILLQDGPAGSVYGMRWIDGKLWFAAADTDQFIGEADATTGLYVLDTKSGVLDSSYPLPATDGWQTLGDLVVHGDRIITADQTDGRLYAFDRASGQFDVLLDRGSLRSPQGMVVDGDHLYVADWNGGLFRLSLQGGDVQRVAAPDDTSLYGIDGLYREGTWLIAIQNGIQPNRVTALRLAEDGERVTESRILAMNHPEFDEPNLGVVYDGAFYFVANSHWNRFDRDNNLPDDLAGPIVMRVALPLD